MTIKIHPSAIVSPRARLGAGVEIGPYCIIGHNVKIGNGSILRSHVVIEGNTDIGRNNELYPFVSIGFPPQDIGYKGEDTRVIIGDGNIFRESVTINRATTKQEWETNVGSNNYLMSYAHVGHDCIVGNNIIMANSATLGGHTIVGDHASIGGLVAVHQFVRIGAHAFIGGMSGIPQDIPPFMIAAGARARLFGPNQSGLKKQGFPREKINSLKKAFRIIWRESGRLSEGVRRVREEMEPFNELDMLLNFIQDSKRGVAS